MSDIVLIDTSVFCEILRIPGKSSQELHQALTAEFQVGLDLRFDYLLPWATILETGNHVGQIGDGGRRRQTAKRFTRAVLSSLDGDAPWAPASPLEPERLRRLLAGFVDWSTRCAAGLGDLSIVDELERQRRIHPARRVWIWSLDRHLQAYGRD